MKKKDLKELNELRCAFRHKMNGFMLAEVKKFVLRINVRARMQRLSVTEFFESFYYIYISDNKIKSFCSDAHSSISRPVYYRDKIGTFKVGKLSWIRWESRMKELTKAQ